MAGRQVQVVAAGYGTLLVQDRYTNTQKLDQPGRYSRAAHDLPVVSH
jgi:hypothetical protein